MTNWSVKVAFYHKTRGRNCPIRRLGDTPIGESPQGETEDFSTAREAFRRGFRWMAIGTENRDKDSEWRGFAMGRGRDFDAEETHKHSDPLL